MLVFWQTKLWKHVQKEPMSTIDEVIRPFLKGAGFFYFQKDNCLIGQIFELHIAIQRVAGRSVWIRPVEFKGGKIIPQGEVKKENERVFGPFKKLISVKEGIRLQAQDGSYLLLMPLRNGKS